MFNRRFKSLVYVSIAFIVLSFAYVSTLHAETDPTKPPIFQNKPKSVATAPKLDPQDYLVTSILVSEQRKVAVINNQVVSIGETVTAGEKGKATVTGINATEVTLSKARQELIVRLPSSQYIKPAIRGRIEGLKDQP